MSSRKLNVPGNIMNVFIQDQNRFRSCVYSGTFLRRLSLKNTKY